MCSSDLWFVARFQIKARPVWSVLMLCLFGAAVFAMFAISGTFISNLDDTFTYNYDNSAFRNGDETRIVVSGPGGGEFTGEDIDKLLGVRYVKSAEEYGYVSDIQYAYREGVDYEVSRVLTEGPGLGADPVVVESFSVRRTQRYMPFIRTIPALPERVEFLTAGRLPENLYEVVAAGGEDLLGQEITVLIQDQKNWGIDDLFHIEVTVVGVTSYGEHLYFHEDLGRILTTQAKLGASNLYLPLDDGAGIIGPTYIQSNGFIQYRCVIDGTVIRMEDAEEGLKQRAKDIIMESMVAIDNFVNEYSPEATSGDLALYLQMLVRYVHVWELESREEFIAAMAELGLDEETKYSPENEADYYGGYHSRVANILMDKENRDRICGLAEPLFQQVKELYEQKKAVILALDWDQVTLEEVLDLLGDWWGHGEYPYVL